MRIFAQKRSGRVLAALLFATLMACGTSEQVSDAASDAGAVAQESDTTALEPRDAIALIGQWVPMSPKRLSGDTLTLRDDHTASGLIPWEDSRDLRVSAWSMYYGSRDSVVARRDWRGGYSDGGDAECMIHKRDPSCISLPTLCIGVRQTKACGPFFIAAPDTLLWAAGMRFRRVHEPLKTVSMN